MHDGASDNNEDVTDCQDWWLPPLLPHAGGPQSGQVHEKLKTFIAAAKRPAAVVPKERESLLDYRKAKGQKSPSFSDCLYMC